MGEAIAITSMIAFAMLLGGFMGSGITLFVQGQMARRSQTDESQRRLEEQVLQRLEGVLGRITDRIEQLDERVSFSEKLLEDRSDREN